MKSSDHVQEVGSNSVGSKLVCEVHRLRSGLDKTYDTQYMFALFKLIRKTNEVVGHINHYKEDTACFEVKLYCSTVHLPIILDHPDYHIPYEVNTVQ